MNEYNKIVSQSNIFFEISEASASVRWRGSAEDVKQHYHNLFEVYFLEEGECNYFIDSRSYRVQAGDLVLIPEGVIHRTNYGEGYHRRTLIHCSRHDVPPSVLSIPAALGYVYRNPETESEVRALIGRIGEEYQKNDAYASEILKEYIRLLFLFVGRHCPVARTLPAGRTYIEGAVHYMQKHYGEELSLSSVAELYSVSPEHFSRSFKRETGFGFHEYLTLLRLQRAEMMLRDHTVKSISQIAYATGFRDSNYFSDRFRREYGVSPREYRKRLGG